MICTEQPHTDHSSRQQVSARVMMITYSFILPHGSYFVKVHLLC